MRIAYVTETWPPEVNGVALSVERTVRWLRERGHAVDVIRPRQRGEAPLAGAGEWRTTGLPIPMYPDLRFGVASVHSMRRHFCEHAAQIVHVATQGPLGRAAVLAANALGLPVAADFRTNFHWYSRYYRLGLLEGALCRYLRNFHNRADRNFVPTQAVRESLAAQGFARLEVIARGVDCEQFDPARRSTALRTAWGAGSEGEPVMLYVGRLAPEKNVELALASFMAVRALRPQVRMVVVGDGPSRRRLQARFPVAHFAGVQRGVGLAEHYASADLFIFPSESETFGNVTLEALASGLAVVAFDAAAAALHIEHGRNGWLARPEDEHDFVANVARALHHAPCGSPLRIAARQAALAARWDAVLGHFERRLAHVAFGSRGTAGLPPSSLAVPRGGGRREAASSKASQRTTAPATSPRALQAGGPLHG